MVDLWKGDTFSGVAKAYAFDDPMGWIRCMEQSIPKDRPVWVISNYGRRCVAVNNIFVKWSILDTKAIMWHPQTVECLDEPPDFPIGFEVEV